jgi:hypothetical protein
VTGTVLKIHVSLSWYVHFYSIYLLILILPQDTNEIQQYFSSESQPTLWRTIPAFEELKMAWEWKHSMPKYELYKVAVQKGLDKVNKYYEKMDEKSVYMLALGEYLHIVFVLIRLMDIIVLHPYYKLEYIKMA